MDPWREDPSVAARLRSYPACMSATDPSPPRPQDGGRHQRPVSFGPVPPTWSGPGGSGSPGSGRPAQGYQVYQGQPGYQGYPPPAAGAPSSMSRSPHRGASLAHGAALIPRGGHDRDRRRHRRHRGNHHHRHRRLAVSSDALARRGLAGRPASDHSGGRLPEDWRDAHDDHRYASQGVSGLEPPVECRRD